MRDLFTEVLQGLRNYQGVLRHPGKAAVGIPYYSQAWREGRKEEKNPKKNKNKNQWIGATTEESMFNKSWAMTGWRPTRILVWSRDGAEKEIPQPFSPPTFQSPVGVSTDQLNHKPKSNGEHTVQHVEVRFLWHKAEQRKAENGLVWKR